MTRIYSKFTAVEVVTFWPRDSSSISDIATVIMYFWITWDNFRYLKHHYFFHHCLTVSSNDDKLLDYYCQWSTGIEILSRPGPGRDDTHPGRDRDRDRDRYEIPAGTGISFIPAGTGTGTGIFPLIFTICQNETVLYIN